MKALWYYIDSISIDYSGNGCDISGLCTSKREPWSKTKKDSGREEEDSEHRFGDCNRGTGERRRIYYGEIVQQCSLYRCLQALLWLRSALVFSREDKLLMRSSPRLTDCRMEVNWAERWSHEWSALYACEIRAVYSLGSLQVSKAQCTVLAKAVGL